MTPPLDFKSRFHAVDAEAALAWLRGQALWQEVILTGEPWNALFLEEWSGTVINLRLGLASACIRHGVFPAVMVGFAHSDRICKLVRQFACVEYGFRKPDGYAYAIPCTDQFPKANRFLRKSLALHNQLIGRN